MELVVGTQKRSHDFPKIQGERGSAGLAVSQVCQCSVSLTGRLYPSLLTSRCAGRDQRTEESMF